jgi:uncharacterized protein
MTVLTTGAVFFWFNPAFFHSSVLFFFTFGCFLYMPLAGAQKHATMETSAHIHPVDKRDRIIILDFLRGFALLGILMVNMPVFNTPFTVVVGDLRPWTDTLNVHATWIIDFFFHGKFYVLFSLLFGMGFYLFLQKIEEAGKTVLTVFRRRLLVLLLIGALHVLLLWYGDILVIYALFGFVMTWFRNKSERTLLIWAIVFLVFPVVFTGSAALLINWARGIPEAAGSIEASMSVQQELFASLTERSYRVYTQGSFGEILQVRLSEYSYMWGGIFSFFPFVMAMFLTGMLAMRRGFLADLKKNAGFFRRLFWLSLPVAVVFNYLLANHAGTASQAMPDKDTVLLIAGMAFGGPSLTFVYISLAVFILNRGWLPWLVEKISITGRMALTNYLTQSIICTTLFYSYGFGLYGRVNIWQGMLITLVIYIVQVVWSHYWLKHYRFGPFEWAWRSLTYRTIQPLKKEST